MNCKLLFRMIVCLLVTSFWSTSIAFAETSFNSTETVIESQNQIEFTLFQPEFDGENVVIRIKIAGNGSLENVCDKTIQDAENQEIETNPEAVCGQVIETIILSNTGIPTTAQFVKTSLIFPSIKLQIIGNYELHPFPWLGNFQTPMMLTFYGDNGAELTDFDQEMVNSLMPTARTRNKVSYRLSNLDVEYNRLTVNLETKVDYINESFSPYYPGSADGITRSGTSIVANGKSISGGGGFNYVDEKRDGDKPVPEDAAVINDTEYIFDDDFFTPYFLSHAEITNKRVLFSSPTLRIEYYEENDSQVRIWEEKIFTNYLILFSEL